LLAVIDRGAGFSESALEHAADPFFSEHPAGRREGLGLSRASRVVDAHGGTLHIRNGARGGAVLTLSFPCPVRTDAPSVDSSAQAA
jgi:signal transduction histidine kinase